MKENAEVIEINDKRYPKALKDALKNLIPSQWPKKLYYKGNWPALSEVEGGGNIFKNCLAVVGSRHLTSYGRRAKPLLCFTPLEPTMEIKLTTTLSISLP